MNNTRIEELRKGRGWTQDRLAAEAGVTTRTVQRLESGSDVSLETLRVIADALEVDIAELFTGSGEPSEASEPTSVAAVRATEIEMLDRQREEQTVNRDAAMRLFHTLGLVAFLVMCVPVAWVISGDTSWWPLGIVPLALWLGGMPLLSELVMKPRLAARFPLARPAKE